MTAPYSPNNPFNQDLLDAHHEASRINNINQQDIDLVFESSPQATHPPAIRIDTLPSRPQSQSEQEEEEEEPPRLPSRPVSPRLPSRPVSPALPPRPPSTLQTQQQQQHLSTQNDIPSPAYTPIASPNETVVPPQPTSEIPDLNLESSSTHVTSTDDQSPPPLPPPPPYSEAPTELHDQIFTLPFSNTGGDSNGYNRPPQPPPPMQTSYARPLGPPPPQRRRLPPGGGYPGNSGLTYGNAAYNSNRPPLPPRQ